MSHKRFLKFGLILLPLLMIGKRVRWRACSAKRGQERARHWPHGPMPHWHPKWSQSTEPETAGLEPDLA